MSMPFVGTRRRVTCVSAAGFISIRLLHESRISPGPLFVLFRPPSGARGKVLDAAGHRDQQHPCGSMRGPEAVCPPAPHEHETAGPDLKLIVAANNRQLTF